MLRSYLTAALRNLVRNKLYAAINIAGLAVGFAAALLIALFVNDELSYDKWIPGHEHIYRVSSIQTFPDTPPHPEDGNFSHAARWLKTDFPEVAAATRLGFDQVETKVGVRVGPREANLEHFYWGDPNFFDVIRLPVVAGDLHTSLQQPDSVAVTRSTARKFFDRDDPIGKTLEISRAHSLTVTAVIEDLPANTHFAIDAIGSGVSSFSPLAKGDAETNPNRSGVAYTYIRLSPDASAEKLQAAMPELIDRNNPMSNNPPGAVSRFKKTSERVHLEILPISAIHLHPAGASAMKPSGNRDAIYSIAAVGLLIVLIAGINFVNLTTARATRRATEVGVRKVSGAARPHLIAQFIGEAVLVTGFAAVIAAMVVGAYLPAIAAAFDWAPTGHSSMLLLAGLSSAVLLVGILAGAYPAFVLSAFRPAVIFKSALRPGGTAHPLRSALVIFQFAALLALALATATIYRQTHFSLNEALRFNEDSVLLVDTSTCPQVLRDEIAALPGVQSAICSGSMRAGQERGVMVRKADGTPTGLGSINGDAGLFELYGVTPKAGRFFVAERAEAASPTALLGRAIVLNESAVQRLGYESSDTALGQRPFGLEGPEVVGIAPDFSMTSVREAVRPTIYFAGTSQFMPFDTLNIKLSGQKIPETLKAIDALWNRLGDKPGPISRRFFDQYTQVLYRDVVRVGALFGTFAVIALLLALLGLYGLASYAAESRTKEIGIRKTMGASRRDILRLLLWEFVKPVLWANVIAWPAAYFIMRRWLEGFAYHIDLELWTFMAASALAVMIAMLTVAGHALTVARAEPVWALRYE